MCKVRAGTAPVGRGWVWACRQMSSCLSIGPCSDEESKAQSGQAQAPHQHRTFLGPSVWARPREEHRGKEVTWAWALPPPGAPSLGQAGGSPAGPAIRVSTVGALREGSARASEAQANPQMQPRDLEGGWRQGRLPRRGDTESPSQETIVGAAIHRRRECVPGTTSLKAPR